MIRYLFETVKAPNFYTLTVKVTSQYLPNIYGIIKVTVNNNTSQKISVEDGFIVHGYNGYLSYFMDLGPSFNLAGTSMYIMDSPKTTINKGKTVTIKCNDSTKIVCKRNTYIDIWFKIGRKAYTYRYYPVKKKGSWLNGWKIA